MCIYIELRRTSSRHWYSECLCSSIRKLKLNSCISGISRVKVCQLEVFLEIRARIALGKEPISARSRSTHLAGGTRRAAPRVRNVILDVHWPFYDYVLVRRNPDRYFLM